MLSCIGLYTFHSFRHIPYLIVKRNPTVLFAVCHKLYKTVCVNLFLRLINIYSNIRVISGTYDSLYTCTLKTVSKVMGCEQMCRRNGNCAKLYKTDYCDPELIVSLKYQHYLVALFYAI